MNQFKDLDKILTLFETQPSYKLLINKIPTKQFFSLQNWPLVQKTLHRYLILWLHRPVLIHGKLNVDTSKSFKMSIGHLHYLNSDMLSVGYVVELPKNVKLQVYNSFVAATIGKISGSPSNITEIPPVQHELMDKFLNAYMQGSTQLIAAKNFTVDFLS